MADLHHNFPIMAPINKVFESISTDKGFEVWWSKKCDGQSIQGGKFHFDFGPEYQWSALVSKYVLNKEFELTMVVSDDDWANSKLGFILTQDDSVTNVQFYHTNWKADNDHYRISNFCWAMYLRLLKRNLEYGEFVPYEDRLNV